MDKQRILHIIKNRRNAFGFTQKDMADKLDIERSQYSRYEIGKNEMTLERFLQISEILGLKISVSHEEDDANVKKQIRQEVLDELADCIEKLKLNE